ncbi:MAG TPA: hypothetical protein ENO05_09320, partial [Bacteroides sp.]|nr:hypothetical protein [Bacteroides sp.]
MREDLWNRPQRSILPVKSNLNQEIMKTIISMLIMLLMSVYGMAPVQSRMISGIVSGESGNPLSGVHVSVKGTAVSTVTDLQGAYRITVDPGSGYLVFTH